jgi:hypothetical protein
VFRENPPDLAPGYGEGTVQETGGLETCVLALPIPTLPSFSFLMFLVRAHQDYFFHFQFIDFHNGLC